MGRRADRMAFLLAAIVVLIAVVPLFAPWTKVLLTIALAKGLAVLGIMVLLRAGQVSFGHALFYAASAYAAAFVVRWSDGGELFVLIAAGVAVSLMLGLVIGVFVVRYRYIFFAMLNLAFSMVLYSILEKFFYVTGGSDGMRIARPTVLGLELERSPFEYVMFYLTLMLVLVIAWAVRRYLQSPLGQALAAVKSNETRLEYLGVSPRHVLLVGYCVSAALAGLGGVLAGVIQGLATPELAYWVRSGEFVFIAILGGAGNVAGAFAGAVVYEGVRTYAAAYFADIWQMVLGGVLLSIILFAPGGLVALFQRLVGGRAVTAAPPRAGAPPGHEEPGRIEPAARTSASKP